MSIESQSLTQPTLEVLQKYGAKDSLLIARGEFWRFITPIFIHIGIIHFLFNTYALRMVGPLLESQLGKKWFLILYFASGIVGNIASTYVNIGIGAGASGAIFGLIGAGYLIEKYVNSYQKQFGYANNKNAFSSFIVLNLALGFMIPGIDNAAHVGGLITGIFLSYILFQIMPNRVQKRNPKRGMISAFIFFVAVSFSIYLILGTDYIRNKFLNEANTLALAFDAEQEKDAKIEVGSRSYFLYTSLLDVYPMDQELIFKRGRLLIISGDFEVGLAELMKLQKNIENKSRLENLAMDLKNRSLNLVSESILSLLKDYPI